MPTLTERDREEFVRCLAHFINIEDTLRPLLDDLFGAKFPPLKKLRWDVTNQQLLSQVMDFLVEEETCPGQNALVAVLDAVRKQVAPAHLDQFDAMCCTFTEKLAPKERPDFRISGYVFISHSSQDNTFVSRLVADLSDAVADVWIDLHKLKGGHHWRTEIFTALNRAESVIVCLTPDAVESGWVRREIRCAQFLDKRILPVIVKPCFEDMGRYDETQQLLELQVISFEKHVLPDVYKAALNDLISQLSDPKTLRHSPYKGLKAFQETDAKLFFGRDERIKAMLARLKASSDTRFLAVAGASGSGKSSLVRAGLLPAIRQGTELDSRGWIRVILSPGARPMVALAESLQREFLNARQETEILETLEENADGLHLLADDILAQDAHPDSARLLVFIDQFEEVFTQVTDEHIRAHFLKLIHAAATIPGGRCLVVVTVRADYLDRLSRYPDVARLFEGNNLVFATDMKPGELLESIEKPAREVGLIFEAGLTNRIVQDVVEQPGALPLLQFALEQLYEKRDRRQITAAAYDAIGGVQQALANHAKKMFKTRLVPEDQAVARRIFLELVQIDPQSGNATSRPRRRSEIQFPGIDDNHLQDVLNILTDAKSRLLVITHHHRTGDDLQNNERQEAWVQISHESLIEHWQRFNDWLAQYSGRLKLRDQFDEDAREWDRNNRESSYLLTGTRLDSGAEWLRNPDAQEFITPLQRAFINASVEQQEREIRSLRRRNVLFAGLAVLFLIAAVVAGIFFISAEQQRQRAEASEAETIVLGASKASDAALPGYCSEVGQIPLTLCGRIKDPALAIQDILAIQDTAPDVYLPELELALALESNRSLLRGILPLAYDPNYVPTIAARDQTLLIGSRAGLERLEYRRVHDADDVEDRYQVIELAQISAEPVKGVAWLDDERFLVWHRIGLEDTLAISSTVSGTRPLALPESFRDQPLNCAAPQPVPNGRVALCIGQTLYLFTLDDDELTLLAPLHDTGQETTFGGLFDRVAWSPDGRWLAAAHRGELKLWDVHNEQFSTPQVFTSSDGSPWRGMQFASGERLLAWPETWDQISVYDLQLDPAAGVFESTETALDMQGVVTAAAVQGDYLAIALDEDYSIQVLDTRDYELASVLSGHFGKVRNMTWTADGYLITVSEDDTLRIWDAGQGDILQQQGLVGRYNIDKEKYPAAKAEITGVRWHHSGSRALVQLRAWWMVWQIDERGKASLHGLENAAIEDAYWFDDQQEPAVIVYADDALRLHTSDMDILGPLLPLESAPEAGTQCRAHFVFVRDGALYRWSPHSQEAEPLEPAFDTSQVKVMNCTTDGQLFAHLYDTLVLWDFEHNPVTVPLTLQGILIEDAAISPDGRYVAARLNDRSLRVWHADNLAGEPEPIFAQAASALFEGFAWMPNSDRLLIYGGTFIYVWNIDYLMEHNTNTDIPPMILSMKNNTSVLSAAFNGDGSRIISIDQVSQQFKVWRSWPAWKQLVTFAERFRTNIEI